MSNAIAAPEPRDALAAVTHHDPYPYYAQLVATAPFARDESLGMSVAANADAVRAVLGDPRALVRPPGEPIPAELIGMPAADIFARACRMTDGARHAALRPLAAALVDAIGIDRLAAEAERITDRVLRERTRADAIAVDRAAVEAPIASLAAALGARPADPGELADDVTRGWSAAERVRARLRPAVGADADVLANAVALFFQLQPATAALIGATLLALARFPTWQRPFACDAATARRFVREVARWDAPVQNTRRYLAGDTILVVLAAANRDPVANPDPARFDPDRVDPVSFTFGAGVHACIGERIATTVAAAVVTRLLNADLDVAALTARYRDAPNVRCPIFGDT
jgi:cytochrome P450